MPNAMKLVEKVTQNCADELISYLTQASKNLDHEVKDGTDSTGEEYRTGQSEIINFPTADDCRKGPKTHWVWKIVKEPSY